ncbi:GNAT family N-acetyltransferase [Paenibacillus sp. TRM 82003]|nr:GNAT family N-acetyltransferase [Paenibacillus sp. TRM 82003]
MTKRGIGMEYRYWQGRTVSLRAMRPSDAALFQALDDDAARRIDAIALPSSDTRQQSWFEQQQKARFDDSFRFVADNREGETVGTIDTFQCQRRNGTFKYGVAVPSAHRGKGYASEMIEMVLRYYFFELGYQKVTPHVYAFNAPSIRLHEKLGFIQEGRLRSMIYTNGAYYDEIHYGMTRGEFEARFGSPRPL